MATSLSSVCSRFGPVISRLACRLSSSAWRVSATPLVRSLATSVGDGAYAEATSFGRSGDTVETDEVALRQEGGARVYRRQRPEHQRVFTWGVGNRFRAQSRNRFMPVHKPHPKEVSVRDNYYESDNPNVQWENLNEAWEVFWYENNKLNARPFPVKKFGIEQAKREASDYYDALVEAGRVHERPKREAPQDGIFYDERFQTWMCFFWRDGRPQSRGFPASKYGFEGAKRLAVAMRNDPVNGVLPAHRGGGTPLALKKRASLGQSLSK
eukprot:TRINITY_DN20000_c0_g1_i1.p1 TRINITY_DN20000_c0_g1~~TRINITY_DN20000_c0_g1_i1.p1  ORF type:complete len:297 (-),score=35.87 TRINITY_DN20000_c0_g1_i1:745-1548(-)